MTATPASVSRRTTREQHVDLGVGEDRRRLVEDQHLGVAGQRLGDRHLLLLGDRTARRPARWRSWAGRPSSSSSSTTLAFCAAQSTRPPLRISRPMKMFSETVSSGNSCGSWYTVAMPSADRVAGARDGDRRAVELDRAGVGRLHPGDDLDHRGLARAVLPDQCVHPPRLDADVGVRIARTAPKLLEMPARRSRGRSMARVAGAGDVELDVCATRFAVAVAAAAVHRRRISS